MSNTVLILPVNHVKCFFHMTSSAVNPLTQWWANGNREKTQLLNSLLYGQTNLSPNIRGWRIQPPNVRLFGDTQYASDVHPCTGQFFRFNGISCQDQ